MAEPVPVPLPVELKPEPPLGTPSADDTCWLGTVVGTSSAMSTIIAANTASGP